MCEPAHSIVQYPQDNDDSFHFGDTESVLSKLGNWTKKIGSWFHISKMGKGHSAATMHGMRELRYLPAPVNYEGFWWHKGSFELDGYHPIIRPDDAQFEAAREYHMRSCMGSMSIFRRFLEASLQNTDRHSIYVSRFSECVLTTAGRDMLRSKIRRLFPRDRMLAGKDKERFIKLVMGFTRKRNLLVPEWSMDDAFWSGRRAE